MPRDPGAWMWAEALALLDRAERMHRSFFQPGTSGGQPVWEPPADIFETEREIRIVLALPGVSAEHIRLIADHGGLVVSGERPLPRVCQTARVHRLEIPHGRFERRIALNGRVELSAHELADGCLFITLAKKP